MLQRPPGPGAPRSPAAHSSGPVSFGRTSRPLSNFHSANKRRLPSCRTALPDRSLESAPPAALVVRYLRLSGQRLRLEVVVSFAVAFGSLARCPRCSAGTLVRARSLAARQGRANDTTDSRYSQNLLFYNAMVTRPRPVGAVVPPKIA